jgi:excisionase family DNA binding protein
MHPTSVLRARQLAGSARSFFQGRAVRRAAQFTPLLDAKAAAQLLGVPHTWLLAQARAGRIPHHRLGHYVRFDPDDLREWLSANRITPGPTPLPQRLR